ncbi:MAG: cysteine hydrolase [Candidatus Thermoplasmatota archaeon]|nr:cysteine hydrolase [Candidatus Thermoplasmatota archaeon]MBU4071577.1 cysteine hydrolase [Candidatus Thermoplasmatota archaeon]MBU4143609.1 cysteine hydrolase [Candidatus Thermoplasmatota archaeon]MBU4591338.1 cysteine hydrolase [Candidatus Thermoplasmatota archaeon]
MSEKLQPEWKYQLQGLRGLNPPPKLNKPALLVIDMQRYFCDPDAPAYGRDFDATVEPVQALVGAFGKLGLPVFATRYYSKDDNDPTARWWNATLEKDSPWVDVDPRIKLPPGSKVLDKHLYGTFSSTDLDERLKALGCDSVVICGVMTDLCCETTAREAFQLSYTVYFVGDATATSDYMLHFSALATLAHGFAFIVTVDDIIKLLEEK